MQWRSISGKGNEVVGKLKVGTKIKSITTPWGEPDHEDGWVGGLLDGEGTIAKRNVSAGMTVMQRDNSVLQRLNNYVKDNDYTPSRTVDNRWKESGSLGKSDVHYLSFGRMDELFRLIGKTRPSRFIENKFWEGRELPGKKTGVGTVEIVSIEPVGEQRLIDLQTSEGTYIAEGLVSHNTTFIDIWTLDKVLFIPNITATIIAHRKEDAATILETKAEIPYLNLHPLLRERLPLIEHNKTTMRFANGSSITVTTSGRSGTSQILHVSELGYTSRHRPDVASEIVNGSFPAVHQKGYIFVESTAEGSSGEFFDICQTAENKKHERRTLTPLDFKFHFYAWHDKPGNALPDDQAVHVVIPDRLTKYFNELENEIGKKLTLGQRAWYVTQEDTFHDKMKQEHPSTPKEAFDNSGDGQYFKTQMIRMREEGRISTFPHTRGRLVHTFWDLGVNDETAVIFAQQIGGQWHVIDYYEQTDHGLDWHIDETRRVAQTKGYLLGDWVGPHDLKQRQGGNAKTLWDTGASMGVKFIIVPKVNHKITSIQVARTMLSTLCIDESLELFIKHIDNYKKEWDKIRGTWKDKPLHDRASNAADALQQWAMYCDKQLMKAQQNTMARTDPRKVNVAMAKDDPSAFRGRTQSGMGGYL